jgi:hypothetical protein
VADVELAPTLGGLEVVAQAPLRLAWSQAPCRLKSSHRFLLGWPNALRSLHRIEEVA